MSNAWRLKAGAAHNSANHQQSQVAQFLNPSAGYRGQLRAKGIQPKNHLKENYLALKFRQAKVREQQAVGGPSTRDLYKLEQFRDVPSRVYEVSQGPEDELNTSLTSSRSESNYVQKGAGERRRAELAEKAKEARVVIKEQMEDARWVNDRPSTPKKGATPKAQELGVFAPRSHANFLRENRRAADKLAPPDTKTVRQKKFENAAKHDNFGRVPEYIEQRKAKIAAEKEEIRKRLPDPNCPPGMKLMPDEERRGTLEVLLKSRTEALKQLQHMPFIVETPSAQRKKLALEDKLKEIEDAVALFSRTKVFVKVEDYNY